LRAFSALFSECALLGRKVESESGFVGNIYGSRESAREEPGVAFSGKCDDSSRNGFAIFFDGDFTYRHLLLACSNTPGKLEVGKRRSLPDARVNGHMISPIIM
jgi:hypothetical protein